MSRSEVEYVILHSKSGRASGPDEIPVELFKLLDEDAIIALLDLYNTIYSSGEIHQEWLLSTFVKIPKESNAKEYSK